MVESGYRGELVSRLLLLEAYATVYRNSCEMYPSPIGLDDFMYNLYQFNETQKKILEKRNISNYEVFLTHFTYVTQHLKHIDLKAFFLRGAGIHCRRNQKGVDHIIPLRHKGTHQYSYILISVKNRKNISSQYSEAIRDCDPELLEIQLSDSKQLFFIFWMEVQPDLDPYLYDPVFLETGDNYLPTENDMSFDSSDGADTYNKNKGHYYLRSRKVSKSKSLVEEKHADYCLIQSIGLSNIFKLFKEENDSLLTKMKNLAISFPDPIQIIKQENVSDKPLEVAQHLLHLSYSSIIPTKRKEKEERDDNI